MGDFYVGVDYRHLFILRDNVGEAEEIECTPPHSIVGGRYYEHLIKPKNSKIAERLNDMIIESREILTNHFVNKKRKEKNKNQANSIWLWGQGSKPRMESMFEKYGIKGAVISAVTLVKGLGVCAGMDKIDVPGATGYYDTDYENKAEYGLEALKNHDLVLIHVEAPDEAGHAGDIDEKIEAIENLDKRLVGKILDKLDNDFSHYFT